MGHTFWRSCSANFLFVEANPSAATALLENLKDRNLSSNSVTVINAALCDTDAVSVPFYTISPALLKEWPRVNLRALEESSSLDREFMQKTFTNYWQRGDINLGYSSQEWVVLL